MQKKTGLFTVMIAVENYNVRSCGVCATVGTNQMGYITVIARIAID